LKRGLGWPKITLVPVQIGTMTKEIFSPGSKVARHLIIFSPGWSGLNISLPPTYFISQPLSRSPRPLSLARVYLPCLCSLSISLSISLALSIFLSLYLLFSKVLLAEAAAARRQKRRKRWPSRPLLRQIRREGRQWDGKPADGRARGGGLAFPSSRSGRWKGGGVGGRPGDSGDVVDFLMICSSVVLDFFMICTRVVDVVDL
jgi:hypothetical protein